MSGRRRYIRRVRGMNRAAYGRGRHSLYRRIRRDIRVDVERMWRRLAPELTAGARDIVVAFEDLDRAAGQIRFEVLQLADHLDDAAEGTR